MNIFISWSGEESKQIANLLKNWIPTILQSAKPYFTPSDIEKGSKWESEITKKLNECKVGIICLTSKNTEKSWILFEAGALSNKLEKSRVCPILFGLSNSDLKGPLATFQTTEFNKEDLKKLMKSINSLLEENKIAEQVFEEVFEAFYPKLESNILGILESSETNDLEVKPKRSDRDILEEILELARKQYTQPKIGTEVLADGIIDTYSKSLTLSTLERALLYKVGDRVKHERFGNGVITQIEITNDPKDIKFEIKFDIGGIKKLLFRFVILEKL